MLIANSNLVPEWATWDEFRRLEALGLTMYGQMTAGSWIYIGTQGILQGTYECFGEIARRRHGGSLAGTITLTAGLGGMGGAQPLAITMNGGVALCVEVDRSRIERRLKTRYLDELAELARRRRRALPGAPSVPAMVLSVGLVANAADVIPTLLARGVRGRHRHRPDQRARPFERIRPDRMSLEEAAALRDADPEEYVRRSRAAIAAHCAAMVGFSDAGAEVFDYGNNSAGGGAARRLRARVRLPRVRARVHPAAVLRGQGPVPLGRAVRRSGRHRCDRPRGAGGVPRRRRGSRGGSSMPRSGSRSGPAGAHLLARLRRAATARAALQRDGRVRGAAARRS